MRSRSWFALALALASGCATPQGPLVEPTGSSARAAYDNWAMVDALEQACADAARQLDPPGVLAVAPATEGAWTLMAASDLATALRRQGHKVRLLDKDLAMTHQGQVVVVKTTYVAVDTSETRIPLSKWSLLEDADVAAGIAASVAVVSLFTAVSRDLGVVRAGCASVTAYVIDPATKKTLRVVTGRDAMARW
jgi:hypothetical protein